MLPMAYASRDSFIFLALIWNFDPVIEIFICLVNLHPTSPVSALLKFAWWVWIHQICKLDIIYAFSLADPWGTFLWEIIWFIVRVAVLCYFCYSFSVNASMMEMLGERDFKGRFWTPWEIPCVDRASLLCQFITLFRNLWVMGQALWG